MDDIKKPEKEKPNGLTSFTTRLIVIGIIGLTAWAFYLKINEVGMVGLVALGDALRRKVQGSNRKQELNGHKDPT